MELVKAWNGKWHLFECNLRMSPAKPVGPYNRIAKPERQIALTQCGEQVMVKMRRISNVEVFLSRIRRWSICTKCWPVIRARQGRTE